MLAKESQTVFSDPEWIYEIKWDGYRAIAEVNNDDVLLYSRNGNTFNNSYPVVVDELKKLNFNAILDGEIVAVDKTGKASFQSLQYYGSDASVPLIYYVFDVLEINGIDTKDLPLTERKKLLKELLKPNPVVKYSDHIETDGEAFFDLVKKKNIEGIMAKKADSLYAPGVRTSNWLKIKHHHSRETVIAGFTAPEGSRKHFGALVLGIYDGNELKYVGHTGTGFNEKLLASIHSKMKPLIQKHSPFKEQIKTNMTVTWINPELVCEIKFTEITREGSLRHPVFLGLREDKSPKEVTMEAQKEVKPDDLKKDKKAVKQTEPKENSLQKKTDDKTLVIGKIKVNITHSSKIYFPKDGITKGDVIEYYQSIAKYILPYLQGRPESLMRTPSGIDKPGFYHKDAGDDAPEWVDTFSVHSESTNKEIDYIICNNQATLAYMNNLGCIEINPWHSTIDKPDFPDYLVIDLDPSENNTFDQVVETANVIKAILDKAGAHSYCKTSGATGLHIYIPTQKKYDNDQVRDFAQLVCMLAHEEIPGFTTMERNLQKRGKDMIYLDYLQNRHGQTLASVYSLRPKNGATVSTPLEWNEVKKGLSPKDFTIFNTLERLKKKGDLFKGVLGKGIDLGKCLKNLAK